MRYITAISVTENGTKVGHITNCLILDPATGKTMALPPKSVAKLILVNKLEYSVGSPEGAIPIDGVRDDRGAPHHIRTAPNGTKDDNLLALPYIR